MSKQKEYFIFLKYKKLLATAMLLFMCSIFYGQTNTVSGKIVDELGMPLPGLSVLVEGTKNAAVSDFDGNYKIKAKNNDVLVFTYVGFITQKVKVNGSTLNISMKNNVASLNEVIVVGYGVQKKETVVGAIGQLSGSELSKRGNLTNLTDALSGSIPGVTVLSSTGIPGGAIDGNYKDSEILIRGKGSWNTSSPLVLVDGVERTFNDIDFNDVKTVTVLKDASATSIFGVKGGNGVLLITTKRGTKSDAKFKVDTNVSFKAISRVPRTLEAYAASKAKNYAIINGLSVVPTAWAGFKSDQELEFYRTGEFPDAYPNRNWTETLLEDYALTSRITASVSGGNDFVKYFGSLGYVTDGDILKTSNIGQGYDPDFKYDRFNYRTNLDFTLTKSTKLEVNLYGFYGSQSRSGAPVFNFWYGIYAKPWTTPVLQYEDGIYGQGIEYERFGQNELIALNTAGIDIQNRGELNSSFKLEQKLDFMTKGLKITGEMAYDNYYSTQGAGIFDNGTILKYVRPDFYTSTDPNKDIKNFTTFFFPGDFTSSTHGFEYVESPLVYEKERTDGNAARSVRSNLMFRVNLEYARKFGKHDISGLALFNRFESRNYALNGWPSKREDWAGRVTYGYDKRYNIEINGAYNGSEKFGPNYKFDFFPSVGLGWTISNEPFFANAKKFINNFKIRYSDGIVGNDNSNASANLFGQWPFVSSYNTTTSTAPFLNEGATINGLPFIQEGTIGNPDLRWETARKQNLGLEVAFFDDKFSMSLDLFKEDRKDIVVISNQRQVPVYFGATPPAANIGQVKLNGYEFVADYRNNINKFNYWASVNFSFVKDEIIIKEDPELKPEYQKAAGFQIDQTRSSLASGIIDSWDQIYTGVVGLNNTQLLPGDYRIIDYNADGFIDFKDAVAYGYPTRPQATYGFALGGDYKGFSLSVNFFGQYNVTQTVGLDEFSFNAPVIYQEQLNNTWLPEYGNVNPTFRALNYGGRTSSNASYNERDGASLRLKTAEFGYTLPSTFIKKIGLSALRFFVNGNNLILWSDLPVDIEGQDYDIRNYPVTKQINVGFSATF